MTSDMRILTPTDFREAIEYHLRPHYVGNSPFLTLLVESLGERVEDFPADHSLGWTAYAKFERAPESVLMGPIVPEGYSPGGYVRDETGRRKRTLHQWNHEQAKLIHAVWNLIPASAKL